MEPRMRILVAGWDSGGGVEAVQTVVRRAVDRGHQVRVLGTEGLRDRFESAGASFRAYRYAPDNDCRSAETDLVKEWDTGVQDRDARPQPGPGRTRPGAHPRPGGRAQQRRVLADYPGGGDAARGVAARHADRVTVRHGRHDQALVLEQRRDQPV